VSSICTFESVFEFELFFHPRDCFDCLIIVHTLMHELKYLRACYPKLSSKFMPNDAVMTTVYMRLKV